MHPWIADRLNFHVYIHMFPVSSISNSLGSGVGTQK